MLYLLLLESWGHSNIAFLEGHLGWTTDLGSLDYTNIALDSYDPPTR